MMLSNVIIIMFEELIGPHHTPEAFWVSVANLPWIAVPLLLIARLWGRPEPFTETD
jgi:hypothetical protein